MAQLNLPQSLKNILEDFTKKLKGAYKDGLVSVILYGSAASGEFAAKHSNINLLVVLRDTSVDNLARITAVINARRFRQLNPLFFTEEYMARSTDVFPIEFLDMKENYVLMYGKDVIRDMRIDIKNLRFQCEHELKAKLINIKKSYLSGRNERELKNLLFQSFTSTMHLLRNLVRLKGKTPSYSKEKLIKEITEELGLEGPVFERIYASKKGDIKLNYREADALFCDFTKELEKAVNIVDRF